MGWSGGVALGMLSLGLAACDNEIPTSPNEALFPVEPYSLELLLPWDEFGSNLQVLGGYGTANALGEGLLARSFASTLSANTLVRFAAYPQSAVVRDSTGTTITDTNLAFPRGRVVIFFDTLASTNDVPVDLALGALSDDWDLASVSWTHAVDTVGERRPWGEPGGGPVVALSTAQWDPGVADSVSFPLDSTQVAALADSTARGRGVRISLATAGHRVEIVNLALRLEARPASRPDTIVVLTAARDEIGFVYDPIPPAPPGTLRVGGAPSWRTVLDLAVPSELNGPAELCAEVGCPVALDPRSISYAGLRLTSRAADPAFQPSDSLSLDARSVLSRSALPKSPLGPTLLPTGGLRVAPGLFGAAPGGTVEVPVTSFVRGLLSDPSVSTLPAPATLALLTSVEPASVAFGEFGGAGAPDAPVLRLIVTVARPMERP